MIAVNENEIKLYGTIENKLRHEAQHNTYDYIEQRVAYTDFIKSNIINNMLLKLLPDVGEDVLEVISKEIRQDEITPDIGKRIKNKVDELSIKQPDVIDDIARCEIDNILETISAMLNVIDGHTNDIRRILKSSEQVNKQLSDTTNKIIELNDKLEQYKQQSEQHKKEAAQFKALYSMSQQNKQYRQPTRNCNRNNCCDMFRLSNLEKKYRV